MNDWLEYKRERGESYKPKGFSSFYNKLLELSNHNPDVARKIVEQSKSNNYAGVFALKKTDDSFPLGFIMRDNDPDRFKDVKGW